MANGPFDFLRIYTIFIPSPCQSGAGLTVGTEPCLDTGIIRRAFLQGAMRSWGACPTATSGSGGHTRRTRLTASAAAVALLGGLVVTSVGGLGAQAAPVVGQGFTVSAADLSFILDQIKIGEAHVVNTTPATGPCGALVGNGPDQIPSPLLSFGIRTVDGSCNNLQDGPGEVRRSRPGVPASDDAGVQHRRGALTSGLGPVGPPGPTSYAQTSGSVVDSEPRTISNLIVDQTSDNPAAVAAAGFPVRTQGNPGVDVCTIAPSTGGS